MAQPPPFFPSKRNIEVCFLSCPSESPTVQVYDSLRSYSMVFVHICRSGVVFASLGLCLQVWPCIGRARLMFAGLGLYLSVWASSCRSGLTFGVCTGPPWYSRFKSKYGPEAQGPCGPGKPGAAWPLAPPSFHRLRPWPPKPGPNRQKPSRVRACICMSGIVFAGFGLYLQVWACICKSWFAFARLACICESGLVFAGLRLCL